MKLLKQLFQPKYKNRIENKIDSLKKERQIVMDELNVLKFTNTYDRVQYICKKDRLGEDIKLLESLL